MEVYNQSYRLEEMKDSMEEAIANITKVNNSQKKLINIINASPSAIDFADFVKGLVEQCENQTQQIEKINQKLALLNEILEMNKDDKFNNYCGKILSLLGVFEE